MRRGRVGGIEAEVTESEGENERGSRRGRMRMGRVEGVEAQGAESEGKNQRGPSRSGR